MATSLPVHGVEVIREKKRAWYPFSQSVDADSLIEAVSEAPLTVIHVWGEWNGSDIFTNQILRTLAPKYRGRISFRSLDVDDESNHSLLAKREVINVPTLLVFSAEELRDRIVGLPRPAALEARLNRHLTAGTRQ